MSGMMSPFLQDIAKVCNGQFAGSTGLAYSAFRGGKPTHAVKHPSRVFSFGEKVMKRSMLVFAVAALASSAAMANADLAKAKNCLACHAVANKVVGPAFKDVAAKYAGQKDAEDKLTQKVLKGSTGVWGSVPMPANAQVNEAEARTLVKWVLSQK
jgi:cytochrome c